MPKFSQTSFSRLSSCHPDLQAIFFEVVRYFDCAILEGHRDEEAQNKAFREGHSKLQWPHGKHNSKPSLAVDCSPYPIVWDNLQRFYWFAGFVMATAEQLKSQGKITHALRFGGDWNKNYDIMDEKGLKDLVHFELIE